VTEALYERYKDALRRGHVAASRSRHDLALDAYSEAARLAPDRALPLVSIGSVLVRLGRTDEALAAYDAALERAPSDEAALRARIELLETAGDRVEAADTLDRLALVLDAAGRRADAVAQATRALGHAESRARRTGLAALIERAAAEASDDPAMATVLEQARGLLDGLVAGALDAAPPPAAPVEPAFDPAAATAAVDDAATAGDAAATRVLALAAARGHRAAGRLNAAMDACYLGLASNPAEPDLHLMLAELYLDRGWRGAATDKLLLLGRLVALTGDEASRARLCAVVTERLPDEPQLTALCA
jgi:tetratricopeptide (TPR) repeat protein